MENKNVREGRNGDGDKIVKMNENCQAGCELSPIDWEDSGKYI